MRTRLLLATVAAGVMAGPAVAVTTSPATGAPGLRIPAGTTSSSAAVLLALSDMVSAMPATATDARGTGAHRTAKHRHAKPGAGKSGAGKSGRAGQARRPRPAGYVDQAGPAVVQLPARTIAADPIVDGTITLHPRSGRNARSHGKASAADGGTVAPSVVPSIVPSPGSWSVERNIERMVHFFALPTSPTSDQYLACAGSGNDPDRGLGEAQQRFECYRVDRSANTQATVPLPDDWFCSAAVHDENGDIVSAGGTRAYQRTNSSVDKTWGGLKTSYRYSTDTGSITRLGDMAVGRWYPNLFKDQDNDIFVQGGQDNGKQQKAWEVMRRGTTTWQTLPFQRVMNSYADMQLIAPDTFGYTGAGGAASEKQPFIINMDTYQVTNTLGLRDPSSRRASSGFLAYPAQAEKVLLVGGGSKSNTGSTDKMDMIDYSVWPNQVPSFVPRASLPTSMMYVQMVNLPNGQIFATGGGRAWRTGDVLWAGFYDIASDTWQMVTPPSVGRDYHSSLWVNTDGTVSVAGGNPGRNVFHSEVETYRPWYMDQQRPVLHETSLPAIPAGQTLSNLAKGATYPVTVDLPSGTTLGSFTLDAARASTHVASDPDQGMFSVPFTTNLDGSVSITVPDTFMLVPGAYKLTAVTATGVPSTSVWVKVV